MPDDEAGKAGVSAAAIHHFKELAAMADKYNLKLIAGLVTGWMSGRLFAPPALERKEYAYKPCRHTMAGALCQNIL